MRLQGSGVVRSRRRVRIAAVVGWLAVGAARSAFGLVDSGENSADIFVLEEGTACYVAELGSVGAYQYELFYTVYFHCEKVPAPPPEPPPDPQLELLREIRDSLVASDSGEEELSLDLDGLDSESDGETELAEGGGTESAAAPADSPLVALIHDGDGEGGPEFNEYQVSAIESTELDSSGIKVLGCIGESCTPLSLACLVDRSDWGGDSCPERVRLIDQFCPDGESECRTGLFFQVERGPRGLQRGEDIRLFLPAGLVEIRRTPAGEPESSPEVVAVLPRLGDSAKGVLASQPLFKFSLSPLTDNQQEAAGEGGDAASVFFAGGVRKIRPTSSLGLVYEGSLATTEEVSFSSIRADFEYERNLRPSSFLPLKLSAGAETNQGIDVVNALARASVEFLLPFNVNYSPDDEDYIPNLGPMLRLVGEVGTRVEESSEMAETQATPESFERAGYELAWTIPVARATVINLRAAGLWVFASDMPDDFHDLWEVKVETRIGNLDYYLGYQKGEAAPLFQPVETTQAGLLIKFGDKFQCEKEPGSGSKFRCDEP